VAAACSATYQNAINSAVSRGTTVVVSAGNDNLDAGLVGSLSTCTNVVVVGAHTDTAARSSFSNYGSVVDRQRARELDPVDGQHRHHLARGRRLRLLPGHLDGGAARDGSGGAHPGLSRLEGPGAYTPAQMEAILRSTAYRMNQGCAGSTGAGIVDARLLLDTANGYARLLASGVAVANQGAAANVGLRYAMVVKSVTQGLTFSSSGGTGDATLYVKYGSVPTTSSYTCRSSNVGNTKAAASRSRRRAPTTCCCRALPPSPASAWWVPTAATDGRRRPTASARTA
jgi:serine protease